MDVIDNKENLRKIASTEVNGEEVLHRLVVDDSNKPVEFVQRKTFLAALGQIKSVLEAMREEHNNFNPTFVVPPVEVPEPKVEIFTEALAISINKIIEEVQKLATSVNDGVKVKTPKTEVYGKVEVDYSDLLAAVQGLKLVTYVNAPEVNEVKISNFPKAQDLYGIKLSEILTKLEIVISLLSPKPKKETKSFLKTYTNPVRSVLGNRDSTYILHKVTLQNASPENATSVKVTTREGRDVTFLNLLGYPDVYIVQPVNCEFTDLALDFNGAGVTLFMEYTDA